MNPSDGVQIAFAFSDSFAIVALFLTTVCGIGMLYYAHRIRTKSFGHSWSGLSDVTGKTYPKANKDLSWQDYREVTTIEDSNG